MFDCRVSFGFGGLCVWIVEFVVTGMSWATYGTWVYRVEWPSSRSVKAALPHFIDIEFDDSYKLWKSCAQRISTEPRVPMFEGFTMPPLTHDSERNAMYKQVQCRPVGVHQVKQEGIEQTEEVLVSEAFKLFSKPVVETDDVDVERSRQAHTAFTKSFLDWKGEMEKEAQLARYRFAERYEYPSLWETAEMIAERKKRYLKYLEFYDVDELPPTATDFDENKPRCTVAMYSSLLAQQRIANLEGLARARQNKPKRRRDEDARLHEEYVKMHTLGENDDVGLDGDNDENMEALLEESCTKKIEIFPPISLKLSAEEQKQLLLFELQGRKNDYVKAFLQETWMRDDVFEAAMRCRDTEHYGYSKLLHELSDLDKDGVVLTGLSAKQFYF